MTAYLLALLLLLTPMDPPCGAADDRALWKALQDLAVELEILDDRERRWTFSRTEHFDVDLASIRGRLRDYGDAPPLAAAERFPDRGTIDGARQFNREFRKHLEDTWPAASSPRLDVHEETLAEVDQLYRAWDLARDTQFEYYYVTTRRRALKDLRDAIGQQAFAEGRLPPHVPLWRFREID